MMNLKAIIFCMFMIVLIIVLDSYRWWRKFKQPKRTLIKNVIIDFVLDVFMWFTIIMCPILEKPYSLYIISVISILTCTYIVWIRRLFMGYNHDELSYKMSERLLKIANQGVVIFELITLLTATFIWIFGHIINKL